MPGAVRGGAAAYRVCCLPALTPVPSWPFLSAIRGVDRHRHSYVEVQGCQEANKQGAPNKASVWGPD